MSHSKILELVEALRKAGQMDHLINCNKHGSRPPWDHCSCIASDHNAATDAAAKALVAEIAEVRACLHEAMEWCKPVNYESPQWKRWTAALEGMT